MASSATRPAQKQLKLVERRFYALPVHKEEVQLGKRVDPDAVSQAAVDFHNAFGRKPTASQIAFAARGETGCIGMQGSRLRESTQRAILARLASKTALTPRQQCFWEECQQWQREALWLSLRTLVVNSGVKSAQYRAELDWSF